MNISSISKYNLFRIDCKESDVNYYGTSFSLTEFMLDMTFKEFFNAVKNWLNLRDVYTRQYGFYRLCRSKTRLYYKDYTKYEKDNVNIEIDKSKTFSLIYTNVFPFDWVIRERYFGGGSGT